jgi:hypothetical protein
MIYILTIKLESLDQDDDVIDIDTTTIIIF